MVRELQLLCNFDVAIAWPGSCRRCVISMWQVHGQGAAVSGNCCTLASQAVELEIDSYCGLVKEMGTTADALVRTNHPQAKAIKERQQVTPCNRERNNAETE